MQYFVDPIVTDRDVTYDFLVFVVNLAPVAREQYPVASLGNSTDRDDSDADVGSVQGIP